MSGESGSHSAEAELSPLSDTKVNFMNGYSKFSQHYFLKRFFLAFFFGITCVVANFFITFAKYDGGIQFG